MISSRLASLLPKASSALAIHPTHSPSSLLTALRSSHLRLMSTHAAKTALVPVCTGNEDIETISIVDVLRRGGVTVTVASTESSKEIRLSNGTVVKADALLSDVSGRKFDGILLPGGPGCKALADVPALITMLKQQDERKALWGGICAAPAVVLSKAGLIGDRRATCYPSKKGELSNYVDEKVVVDGNLVTSQGPGTAIAFALQALEQLAGAAKAREVRAGMLA